MHPLSDIVAVTAVLWIAGKLFRRWVMHHYTVLSDLPSLGTRRNGPKVDQTAIICGGSIAGLLNARICTDHFRRVVVVDPDAANLIAGARSFDLVSPPPPHARVMQYELFHTVQGMFTYGLMKLFPGTFVQELAAIGAIVGPANYNRVMGGILFRAPFDQLPEPSRTQAGLTRAAYETILRRMVAMDKRIEFINGTVIGFDVRPSDTTMLGGVRYRPADDAKVVVTLKGDLIIDCTGTAHSGLSLLQRANPAFALPKEVVESYQPRMVYIFCVFENAAKVLAPYFQRADGYNKDAPGLAYFLPIPSMDTRFMALIRVEGNKLLVLAGGAGFSASIECVTDLRVHAQNIRGIKPLPPWLFSVLDNLEAQGVDYPGKYSKSNISPMHWVKYHEHTMSLPSNFVASGDALQRLNPIAGQGMAKAMVEATTLDAVLRASVTPTIGPAFFKKVAARTGSVWTSTKIGDYAYEVCEPALGETREFGARQRKFNRRIGKRALAGDQDIQLLIMGIRSWVLPPTDMLAPSVLMKLALDWICGQ